MVVISHIVRWHLDNCGEKKVSGGQAGLRVVNGGVTAPSVPADPDRFQADCVEGFVASWTARGYSTSTIDNDIGVLERMLGALGRPAWEVTADDVDRVVGALAEEGRAVSTRRNYVGVFRGFHRFLQTRKAAEIEAMFGVRLVCPIDEFNSARHVSDDSPATDPPPSPQRLAGFFEFLKDRVATARKYAPAARDYALFRTLYHAGLRCEEATALDAHDVHVERGPFGKLHVRFGKAARTSGPRPRWVPMLDGLEVILGWYLTDVRGRFPESGGVVLRRIRRAAGDGHGPQPAPASDGVGGTARCRLVQSSRAAPGVRDA